MKNGSVIWLPVVITAVRGIIEITLAWITKRRRQKDADAALNRRLGIEETKPKGRGFSGRMDAD